MVVGLYQDYYLDMMEDVSIHMTPLEFEAKMKELLGFKLNENIDLDNIDLDVPNVEELHKAADDILCEVLESLGYIEGVEIFKSMPKWYA